MSWTTPTVDTVMGGFTPQENDTINRLMGGALNDPQILTDILERVVAEIHGYIRAGGYPFDPDETKLPQDLFNDVIAMTRWRYLVSIPQMKQFQTDARMAANDESFKKMVLVATRKFAIEAPDGSGEPDRGGAVELVGDQPRVTSREMLARL